MMRTLLIGLCAAWAGLAEADLLLTDVAGKAQIDGSGPVATLAEVPEGSKLRLLAGARVVAVDLKSGREYVLVGPSLHKVIAAGLTTTEGTPAKAVDLPVVDLPNVRVATRHAGQAALVMREVRAASSLMLLSPVRTTVLANTPTLRWSEVEGADLYRVTLTDAHGKPVLLRETTQNLLAVTKPSPLVAGQRYRWRVEALQIERFLADASAEFSVLSDEMSAQLTRLRDDSTASIARRVLYAAQLQEAGAVEEAKAVWRELASLRPDDLTLNRLAQ